MAFDAWIQKLDRHSRIELLFDLLDTMTDDAKAELVEQLATDLNDKGYEWDYATVPIVDATKGHYFVGIDDDNEQDYTEE